MTNAAIAPGVRTEGRVPSLPPARTPVAHGDEVRDPQELESVAAGGRGQRSAAPAASSVLLDIAADEAARQGLAVLRCSGHESERGLVFAGLHELLRPVLADLRELPGSQAEALRQAFGLEDVRVHGDNSPNHRLLINLATLTLRPARVRAGRRSSWSTTCSGSTSARWTH
jgi:hypothetical protein